MTYEEILQSVDNSIEEIDIKNMLDNFSIENRNHNFENILQKLRHKGTISLSGLDLLDCSRAVMRRDMTPKEMEDKVFSIKSASNILDIVELLTNYGFTILKKRINNYEYYIKARRP